MPSSTLVFARSDNNLSIQNHPSARIGGEVVPAGCAFAIPSEKSMPTNFASSSASSSNDHSTESDTVSGATTVPPTESPIHIHCDDSAACARQASDHVHVTAPTPIDFALDVTGSAAGGCPAPAQRSSLPVTAEPFYPREYEPPAGLTGYGRPDGAPFFAAVLPYGAPGHLTSPTTTTSSTTAAVVASSPISRSRHFDCYRSTPNKSTHNGNQTYAVCDSKYYAGTPCFDLSVPRPHLSPGSGSSLGAGRPTYLSYSDGPDGGACGGAGTHTHSGPHFPLQTPVGSVTSSTGAGQRASPMALRAGSHCVSPCTMQSGGGEYEGHPSACHSTLSSPSTMHAQYQQHNHQHHDHHHGQECAVPYPGYYAGAPVTTGDRSSGIECDDLSHMDYQGSGWHGAHRYQPRPRSVYVDGDCSLLGLAAPQEICIIETLGFLDEVCCGILKQMDAQRIARGADRSGRRSGNCMDCLDCVALDLEGKDLGKNGTVCIITLATTRCVYILDVVELGPTALRPAGPLRSILESPLICKLMFDCRADCDALYSLYSVRLRNVCDLQVAACYRVAPGGRHLPGMKDVFRHLGLLAEEEAHIKEMGRACFDPKLGGTFDHWISRPLAPLLLQYCAVDVKHFFSARDLLRPYLNEGCRVGEARLQHVCEGWFDLSCKGNALRDFDIQHHLLLGEMDPYHNS